MRKAEIKIALPQKQPQAANTHVEMNLAKKPPGAGLYLVATPIGHAQDITLRALNMLRQADYLFCEDTRVSGNLLRLHGISANKRLRNLHEHNEHEMALEIVKLIKQGKSIAYLSDAGLPLISDPGAFLVQQIVQHEMPVTSLPGANAALTALQLSGLPTDRFTFHGFLPAKAKARQEMLQKLATIPITQIFYEAPHRIEKSLTDMLAAFGPRQAVVARELTKLHEEVLRGSLDDLLRQIREKEKLRGEMVVVIAPAEKMQEAQQENDVDLMLREALKTMSARDAAFHVSSKTGLKRRAMYQRLVELDAKK